MSRAVWVVLAVLATGLPAAAQPLGPLEPTGGPPEALDSTPVPSRANPTRLPPVLGAPVGLADRAPTPGLAPAGFADAPAEPQLRRAAGFGAPSIADGFGAPPATGPATPVSAAVVDAAVARTAYTTPAVDPVNEFLHKRSNLKTEKLPGEAKATKHEAGKLGDTFEKIIGDHNGGWFRSDHLFDGFISPVSNPFLAEDPRSLTELRPIFIYQKVPTAQRDFRGGNITFFGAQARVALTDRWSVVFNKLGGISVNPGTASPYNGDTGFSELWLGPKYTFYRGEENGALVAAGVQFQLPLGSKAAFQDTGSLSLVPYVSYGQNFLRDFRLGSFNSIITTGYSFGTDNQRSDYYYLSAHLDFDILHQKKFYPLAELNWLVYTGSGHARPFGSEGRDLINFGGSARSGLLTGTLGGRVKITESAQLGAGFEIPLAGRKDFFRYRFTVDFILRY